MAEPPSGLSVNPPPAFTELNDLISERIGGKIIFSTDDWFAVAENLLRIEDPVFDPEAFTDYGKLMDGWETRRKRIPGHDWCIIQLGAPGVIHGVDIDTSFFTGNYAPRVSIQAASINQALSAREGNRIGQAENAEERDVVNRLKTQNWTEILPRTEMGAGYKTTCHNYHTATKLERWTHIRLNIYPDGGISRLRLYGQVFPDWSKVSDNEVIDLAAMLNGGICVGYSNVHYGHARNMIGPGRSKIMADGWETARRLDRPHILEANDNGVLQVPGSEWAAFKLGHPGVITKIEIDTNHFKGNFPDSCWVEACFWEDTEVKPPDDAYRSLLPVQKLSAHKRHYYEGAEILTRGVVSHVRVSMAPDGGISRVRFWGTRESATA